MAENHLGMSPREWQIAELLLQGCENGEIAQLLKMKRRTVKAYMNRLFRRFEIKDGIKRVKLATLLYRRLCAPPHTGPSGVPASLKNGSSGASLSAESLVTASGMPKWPAPPLELQTNRDGIAELNIQRTA